MRDEGLRQRIAEAAKMLNEAYVPAENRTLWANKETYETLTQDIPNALSWEEFVAQGGGNMMRPLV